jgi:Ca2+-dependent lipid-binding protein
VVVLCPLCSLNPVFTEETNNTFVLDCPVMDLYTKNGIFLNVKDWDRGIGGDDDLGSVQIPPDVLYDFGSEAKEFQIEPPSGKSDAAGFITIRCNPISAAERDSRKKGGMFSKLTGSQKGGITAREVSFHLSGYHLCVCCTLLFLLTSIGFVRSKMDFSDLSLLVEIVSCQNLIIADINSSDPYVKVKMGDKDVHTTKYINNK